MTPTEKVLGQIEAINTIIENFPMSILDRMHGKVYTSAFEFIVDLLNACGVNTNEIIEFLLGKIYGIEARFYGGLDAFYNQLSNGSLNIDIDEKNEFIEMLETSIKSILMALLSSLFSCSALPILPNKIFDSPDAYTFRGKTHTAAFNSLTLGLFEDFTLPISLIDPLGVLGTCPTSREGRCLYSIEGRDEYYHKEFVSVTKTQEKIIEIPAGTPTIIKREEKVYNDVRVGLSPVASTDNLILECDKEIDTDIHVKVIYVHAGEDDVKTWEGTILSGTKECKDILALSAFSERGDAAKVSIIHKIVINGNENNALLDNHNNWIYLSKEYNRPLIDLWLGVGATSIETNVVWGTESTEYKVVEEVLESVEPTTATTTEEVIVEELQYVKCTYDDARGHEIVRTGSVPKIANNESADFIVCYMGLKPDELYKTNDMDAFLWYVMNKGTICSQVEKNHLMWDSRRTGNVFKKESSEEWNAWYNSKNGTFDNNSGGLINNEFKLSDNYIVDSTVLYPIMQLEPYQFSRSMIKIQVPAQRYFMPKYRTYLLRGFEEEERPQYAFNASMFEYNWDYLKNIKILHPKVLFLGLVEYLLGFALSPSSPLNVNFTKKVIEAKISSAVKNIIEADDMEIEDCYMEFSNDEFNTMMEEMLLSRYNATQYGGETNTIRVHDVQDYMDSINNINSNASVAGNTTQIKKLINDITTTDGTEGSIDYGFKTSLDAEMFKKILMGMVTPIAMSIFRPQVLLIIYFNLGLMGLTRFDTVFNQDLGTILNFLLNKIMSLIKSIILFIKDKIIELLLTLVLKVLMPLIFRMEFILMMERIEAWMTILKAAIECIPIYRFKLPHYIGSIDEVNYADIVNNQNTPESTALC